MDVFDASGGVDSTKLIEYIAKQFPGELKTLIETRDELAKRQGAMSAVDAANADRAKAAEELASAKAAADEIMANAKAKADEAAAQKADLAAIEKSIKQQSDAFQADMTDKLAKLAQREQQVTNRESAVASQESSYAVKKAALDADRAALDARIKAFQDKVAALSA